MSGVKCLVGACIAALVPAGASAQEAEKPHSTETLVVTATRIEKSVYDIPAAIDAVSGDELRAHRVNVDLSEGVGRIPGIVVQNRYNYAQDLQVSSRGFGARAAFGVRGVRLLQDDRKSRQRKISRLRHHVAVQPLCRQSLRARGFLEILQGLPHFAAVRVCEREYPRRIAAQRLPIPRRTRDEWLHR